MQIIIAPAKKMRVDVDSFAPKALPRFLSKTQQLQQVLQSMSHQALKTLWGCSEPIAAQNIQRLQEMDLLRNLTPAIFSYEGIQYQYIAPHVLETRQLDYLQKHLYILSGFYGLLRPFDGVTPYRLEMQARLSVSESRNLYDFWGTQLADQLAAETGCVINLASKEYSRAIVPHLSASVRILTCTFGEEKNGRVVEKGTMCKMARGEMVRWLAEHNVSSPEELRGFTRLAYRFDRERSSDSTYVFLKQTTG